MYLFKNIHAVQWHPGVGACKLQVQGGAMVALVIGGSTGKGSYKGCAEAGRAVIFGAGPSNELSCSLGQHVKDRLTTILQQVHRLVAERNELKARLQHVDGELSDLRRMEEVLRARVAELERENGVLRKARSAEAGAATAGTKERIDELVHEIDRCLALLTPAVRQN